MRLEKPQGMRLKPPRDVTPPEQSEDINLPFSISEKGQGDEAGEAAGDEELIIIPTIPFRMHLHKRRPLRTRIWNIPLYSLPE